MDQGEGQPGMERHGTRCLETGEGFSSRQHEDTVDRFLKRFFPQLRDSSATLLTTVQDRRAAEDTNPAFRWSMALPTDMSQAIPSESPPTEPMRIKHYIVDKKLGKGGMGQVFLAYDTKLRRPVALKTLRSEVGQELKDEARAMARLNHPNIIKVYGLVEAESVALIEMEYIDGITLRSWIEAEPRSRSEILSVFIAAGEGLVAAHAAKMIHRDFKPENVMIRNQVDDERERPIEERIVLMDFGLACGRPHPEGHNADSVADPDIEPGIRAGTPAYMAPEQWQGNEVTARSDQFAFCASLWWALFGEPPFRGTDLDSLENSVTSGRIQIPRSHGVPPWLEEILRRGLQVDPEQRFESMQRLLDLLADDPRRRRTRRVMYLVVIFAVVVTGWFLEDRITNRLTSSTLDNELEKAIAKTEERFASIDSALATRRNQITLGSCSLGSHEDAFKSLYPFLRETRLATHIIQFSEEGSGYVLERKPGEDQAERWCSRAISAEDSPGLDPVVCYELDESGLVGTPDKGRPRLVVEGRPWYTTAKTIRDNRRSSRFFTPRWTLPYEYQTTRKPGISYTVPVTDAEGSKCVIAFDVLLEQLSEIDDGRSRDDDRSEDTTKFRVTIDYPDRGTERAVVSQGYLPSVSGKSTAPFVPEGIGIEVFVPKSMVEL